MASYQYVKVSIEDRIAILTVDHPPANVLNSQAIFELEAVFDEVLADPQVKVVIITGAGDLFMAGADVKELQAIEGAQEGRKASLKGQVLFSKIEASTKPVIAAINGRFCLGGGNELAMACHIRIAEKGVRLGQPEISLGIIPGWGGTQRLPRLVGRGKALELLLTGDMISAEEAYRIGLVDRVVEVGQAIQEAKELARAIASKGALAIAACLEAVHQGLRTSLQEGLLIEIDKFGTLFETEDMREGIDAFLAKPRRQPQFKDK